MEQLKNESSRQYEYMEEMKKWVQKKSGELGRKLTCHVTTFGCQMNEKDSEKLLGILETIGYEEVETEGADFLIFNTCTVRENANTKLYGHLGQVKKMKERNPQMMIGLCGCMMQEEHLIEKIRSSYKFVDIIFGTHNIFKLAELLKARVDSKGMIVDIWKDTDQIVEDLPSDRKFSFKCGVNIMYGCNNFCSYCIVPYVRGRERSRKPEDIIKEVKQVVSEGVKEVMLLGQNVNSYGKTLEEPMSFAEFLREVEKVEGLERIRFMTSAKNCKKKVGDIERVLIEEENTHEEGMLTGRLENNLLVHFKGCKEQIGTMADVKLVEEKGFYYMGEQIHG